MISYQAWFLATLVLWDSWNNSRFCLLCWKPKMWLVVVATYNYVLYPRAKRYEDQHARVSPILLLRAERHQQTWWQLATRQSEPSWGLLDPGSAFRRELCMLLIIMGRTHQRPSHRDTSLFNTQFSQITINVETSMRWPSKGVERNSTVNCAGKPQ